ncbi:SIR2 family NAD-dependent protein deacylase [Caballeronia grimmiae]|uniref:SIR2 family NAD-dependent protein deacylase n=1 Tax=Caballeronia grimmiae TaxID=1071679 RepID=UPI0038BAA4E7
MKNWQAPAFIDSIIAGRRSPRKVDDGQRLLLRYKSPTTRLARSRRSSTTSSPNRTTHLGWRVTSLRHDAAPAHDGYSATMVAECNREPTNSWPATSEMSNEAPKLFVFSGAGLSAESGLSTFRTGNGIWSRNSIDEVCNIRTWRRNREAVFRFYNELIREKYDAQPNAAHQLLAAWQHRWGADRVELLTQNVDDLLEKAGATSVIHLHGDLNSLLCTACDLPFPKEGLYFDPTAACPLCGNYEGVKPGVVFFGEAAPAYNNLHRLGVEMRPCDLFLAVGSAFEVVSPESMLPWNRQNAHPRNLLVDPSPSRREMFGIVEATPATIGLQRLEERVAALMQ